MNRFAYEEARLTESESFVSRDRNVKIYDGDQKVDHITINVSFTIFGYASFLDGI